MAYVLGDNMPLEFIAGRLPQWQGMWHLVRTGLGLMAACSLASCATYSSFGPPNALSLSDDHTEIIMTGEMRDGLSDQVKHLLDADSGISAIKLESPGGSGNEGYKLALLVKEHHLATFSSTLCASACTFVYMAGAPRFFVATGKLGFHSTSVAGVKSAEGNRFSQILYQEAGVPQAFIDRALATAPKDIWFPTTEELVKSHIVTDIVPDQRFVPSSRKYWSTEEQLDRELKSDSTIAAVARLDPANYKKIHDIFMDGARQGRGIAQIQAASSTFITNNLLPSYYRRAPDDVVIRYARLQLAALRYIKQNEPGSCVAIAVPKSSISEFSDKRLPKELSEQDSQALTDLITAALHRPDHPEEDAINRHAVEEFKKTTLAKSPAVTKSLEALKQDSRNQVLYCQVLEAVIETTLDQPAETAARIIRGLQLTND